MTTVHFPAQGTTGDPKISLLLAWRLAAIETSRELFLAPGVNMPLVWVFYIASN